ncbi:MAG TPA: hypothetical protein VFW42_09615, partial [Fluviicoccus sp.]|nr:hypothetical protein [Fluviicoccus sp.]
DLNNEQRVAFNNLIENINAQLIELEKEFPENVFSFQDESLLMKSQFEKSLNEFAEVMDAHIADKRNWSGIKEFREVTGIGPKELNNIQPPNVVVKIFDIYKGVHNFSNMDIGVDDFFGLIKNPVFPERPYCKHQKITVIYNMLNTIGYYPDSQVKKERRFIASLSDTSHASFASFCDVLFSRDEYFIKKVKAVYEYLEIPTKVYFVSLTP